MRLVAAALSFLLLTGAAHAQKNQWSQEKNYRPDYKEKQRKIDEAYQATIKTQPAPVATDPWGNVRASETTPGQLKGGPKGR